MAKPSWVTISKSFGSGNDTFTIGANSVHTGRVVRYGTVTVQGSGVSGSKTINVSQAAKTEFIDLTNTSTSIGKDGGNVTVLGTTNAKTFTIEWVPVEGTAGEYTYDSNSPFEKSDTGINYPEIALPKSIVINGQEYSILNAAPDGNVSKDYFIFKTDVNGLVFKIEGAFNGTDPGADNEYNFSFVLTFPKNESVESVSRTMLATAGGGQTNQIIFKQTAQAATLSVSPTTISLNNSGTAQTVTVTSNTTWTVS